MTDCGDPKAGQPADRSHQKVGHRKLLNAMFDPVLGVDSGGRLRFTNDAAISLWGVDAERHIGMPVSTLFEGESGRAMEDLCRRGCSGLGESLVSLPDGRTLSFSISQLEPDCLYVILRDRSRREELEQELRQARRMASVGRLAAEVAHEINNPLAVIQGRLEMLRVMPEMPAQMRDRHISILEEQSGRVAQIVQNLQVFARPRTPNPRSVSLSESLEAALARLGRRAGRVQIEQDLPEDATLYIDPELGQVVWDNLLLSAINCMPSGQSLIIRAPIDETGGCKVQLTTAAGHWPEAILAELRSPYLGGAVRVDPGRGLALAISWGIIQDHGGWLTAQNIEGGGAALEAYFPGPSHQTSTGFLHPGGRTCLDVLVVDDDTLMAETVAWMLSTLGHRACIVGSAEEGLSRLESELFHVVLTDQRLPGMDGETMLAKVRREWPELASRTILTSGLLHRPTAGQAYLQKPFSSQQLESVLAKLQ